MISLSAPPLTYPAYSHPTPPPLATASTDPIRCSPCVLPFFLHPISIPIPNPLSAWHAIRRPRSQRQLTPVPCSLATQFLPRPPHVKSLHCLSTNAMNLVSFHLHCFGNKDRLFSVPFHSLRVKPKVTESTSGSRQVLFFGIWDTLGYLWWKGQLLPSLLICGWSPGTLNPL